MKAAANDFPGRFREIVSDPLNLLIRRDPLAGTLDGTGCVVLHNGARVPLTGPGAYYGGFSQILVINRGVHEPLEEFAFQEMLPRLPGAPVMLELGAYWAHYSIWLKRARSGARIVMVEPEASNAAAGRANLARNRVAGTYLEDLVGRGRFEVDAWMAAERLETLDILHCDIQGAEGQMLDGAARALAEGRVGYWFVSTHGQALHAEIAGRLAAAGCRIELDADVETGTTSHDGFILAAHPGRPRVIRGPAPLGRAAVAAADPRQLVESLLPHLPPA